MELIWAIVGGAVSGFVGGWFGGRWAITKATTSGSHSPVVQTSGDNSPAHSIGRDHVVNNVHAAPAPDAILRLSREGDRYVLGNVGECDALNVEWGTQGKFMVAARGAEASRMDRVSAGVRFEIGLDASGFGDRGEQFLWVEWDRPNGERSRSVLPV